MEETGFSTNKLLTNLREKINNHKDKYSCEEIQELFNIMSDLEYEVHLLQTNYQQIQQQEETINTIDENVCEILKKCSENNLYGSDNESDDNENNDTKNTTGDFEDSQILNQLAESISTLVVQKIAASE